jgi:glycosyltransferase involved in cell wall biosynthesis
MKIHVLGLPHTVTSKEFTTCAFTQKALKLCAMMSRRGHEVYHYGVEGSDVEARHVSLVSRAEFDAAYPHPGRDFYGHATVKEPYVSHWTSRLRDALRANCSASPWTDIVAMTWGGPQRGACEGLQQFQVESGIGYPHSWADYRVYESYAWLHMHLGRDAQFGGGKFYYTVIPNAFDLSDFETHEPDRVRSGFLYLGRLNADKGVGIAVDVSRRLGKVLTIVGQGDPAPFVDGNAHVRYLPPVGVKERARLLSSAEAVFAPTLYVEPFGGVAVEAQICGTPVITTDFGAFTETVLHGRTGFRCRTFEHFMWAARNVHAIDRVECKAWAQGQFSMEGVAGMYEEFFGDVLRVGKGGWYEGVDRAGVWPLQH